MEAEVFEVGEVGHEVARDGEGLLDTRNRVSYALGDTQTKPSVKSHVLIQY